MGRSPGEEIRGLVGVSLKLRSELNDLGMYGYYSEADTRYNDAKFAGSLTNVVFDDKGRLTSRKGNATVLATGLGGGALFKRLHYYRRDIGTDDQWLAAADNDKIYKIAGAAGAATATDITGSITTPTSWDWQFVTYNDKVIGIQQGDGPIVYTGTGSFADFNAGATNLPDGNCLLSAWGRLWGTTSDGQAVHWTAALGEDFDAAGSGQLNVRKVWTNGADRIVALAAFNNRLVIFGKQNILIYRDESATTTGEGLNPNSSGFTLEETVDGQGLVGRDAVAAVGNDLVFLSEDGLRSLQRAVDYEKLAMVTLSRNIDPVIKSAVASLTADNTVDLCYHQKEALLLLRVGGSYFYLDPRDRITPNADENKSGIFRASDWTGIPYHSAFSGLDGNLRFAIRDDLGEYSGYNDNDTATYQMDVGSTWLDGGGEARKMLKRVAFFANTQTTYTLTIRWAWDFSTTFETRSVTVSQVSDPAEWGEAEWGEDEWSGDSNSLFRANTMGSGSGTYFKVGFSLGIDGEEFAYNSLYLQMKKGRLTRN